MVKGRWICPRCDYYKLSYQPEWDRHSLNTQALIDEIKRKFPQVSLKKGLGADSAEWIDIPPGTKNEPDIEVWIQRKHSLSIEVSGSAKVSVPPKDIHILRKKLAVAEKSVHQGIDYLFYMVYPNNTFTLTVPIVAAHRRDIVPGGRLPGEKYIPIPPEQALPREEVFNHIQVILSPFYPQVNQKSMDDHEGRLCPLGHNTWWQREDGGWVCQRCHPKPGTFTGDVLCVDLVVVTKVYKDDLLVETRSAPRRV